MSQTSSKKFRMDLLLLVLLLSTACEASSARLLSLECLESCQDLSNPFLLTLALDIDDPEQVLQHSKLHFRFGENPEINGEYTPQAQGKARLLAHVELPSPLIVSEERFTLFARAKDSKGLYTNEVSLDLQIER